MTLKLDRADLYVNMKKKKIIPTVQTFLSRFSRYLHTKNIIDCYLRFFLIKIFYFLLGAFNFK